MYPQIDSGEIRTPGKNVVRVIRNENNPYTPEEIRNKWYKMMNSHLEIDCCMTSPRFGQKNLKSKVVTRTWKGTLKNEEDLPSNWTEGKQDFSG